MLRQIAALLFIGAVLLPGSVAATAPADRAQGAPAGTTPPTFAISGRGWGHGVGMCQVGAYGLAKQGWTAEQILKAYYSGIELTRIY